MDIKTIEFWAEKDLWAEHELIDLCLGIEPGFPTGPSTQRNPIEEDIRRAVFAGKLESADPSDATNADKMYGRARYFDPRKAIEWATGRYSSFPDFDQFSAAPEDGRVSTRRYNNLRKLVFGMAIAKYGYNPEARSNRATGKSRDQSIYSDLKREHLEVGQATIKLILQDAADEFGKSRRQRETN